MVDSRIPLGELLVEAKAITRVQLDHVLELQRTDRRRLGVLLVESGLLDETRLTQALSQQLSVAWVSLYHVDFSRQLLNLVPREFAERYCLIPIFVRRRRGEGDTLYVAMDDPTDDAALAQVAEWAGLPVRPMIAPPSHILAAIRAYYQPSLVPQPRSARPLPPPRPQPSPSSDPAHASPPPVILLDVAGSTGQATATPPPVVVPRDAPLPAAAPPESENVAAFANSDESDAPESGPQIESREIDMPMPRHRAASRMVTLTLLDGTQINLPARGGVAKEKARTEDEPEEQLTARDLVLALRALAQGTEAGEVFGDQPKWERMFAALLSLLLKKQLIADWEFVDEYKRT